MKFIHYLNERQGNTETRAGMQYGNGITFIDIDETVFKTYAKILVVDTNTGETIKELDNQEFNSYKLKPGEDYDFKQFRDSKLFHDTSKPIPDTINRIQRMIDKIENTERGKGSRIVFLTARSDFDNKHKVIDTFQKHGIKIKKPTTYIERSGNISAEYRAKGKRISTEDAKKKVMLKYLKTGLYRRVRLIDDYKPNLKALLDIKNNLPSDIEEKVRNMWNIPDNEPAINFYALWIDENGKLHNIK